MAFIKELISTWLSYMRPAITTTTTHTIANIQQ